MDIDSAELKWLREHGYTPIGEDETFSFGCRRCGRCCCNRDEPIQLTGIDVYAIANALGRSTADILERYTETVPGARTGLPVVFIRELADGCCPFLRKKQCTIQQNKPIVCRLYPLGRIIHEGKPLYITQQNASCGKARDVKVGDWLDWFHIRDTDEECILWNSLCLSASRFTEAARERQTPEDIMRLSAAFYQNLYLSVDMSRPYIETLRDTIRSWEAEFEGFRM